MEAFLHIEIFLVKKNPQQNQTYLTLHQGICLRTISAEINVKSNQLTNCTDTKCLSRYWSTTMTDKSLTFQIRNKLCRTCYLIFSIFLLVQQTLTRYQWCPFQGIWTQWKSPDATRVQLLHMIFYYRSVHIDNNSKM